MKINVTRRLSPALALILILASVSSTIARPRNDSGSSQNPPPATATRVKQLEDRIKRLEAQLDQCGKDLERSLVELEHSQNLNLAKDEKIKALEQAAKAATDLANLYKATNEQLRIADAERARANAIDAERVALYEKRITLYQQTIEAYEKEVTRLRGQRGLRFKLGMGLLAAGLAIGALFGFAVGKN